MALFRRPGSPFFWFKFVIDGRVIRESTKTADRKLAKRIYEDERARYIRREKLGEIEDLRLKDLLDAYLRDYSAVNKRSHKSDCEMSRVLLDFYGENAMASQVTPQSLERFKAHRLAKKVGRHTLSRGTVNRDLNFVSGVFSKGMDWRLVPANPAKGVARFDVRDRARVRYLTQEEEGRLLAVLRRYPLAYRITLIALRSGLRLGEIMRLQWEDLDAATGQIVVRTSKSGKPRYVPCHPDLAELFRAMPRLGPYIVADDAPRIKHRSRGWHALQIGHGKPLSIFGKWRNDFNLALDLAGIRDFRFHDTRHSFASNLVQRGVSLQVVAELLGHSSLSMSQRYAHLSHESKAAAVALLPSAQASARVPAAVS